MIIKIQHPHNSQRRFERVHHPFAGYCIPQYEGLRSSEGATSTFIPRVNVRTDENEYVLDFELPGIRKAEITITLKENVLSISGERKPNEDTSGTWIRRERTMGAFERSIRFRKAVDGSKIHAQLENGVLRIVVPFKETASAQEITIQ